MQLAFLAAVAATVVSAQNYTGESKLNHTCLLVPDYRSCSVQANPSKVDACCVETFGGLVLQTQFWNTYTGLEAQGQLIPQNTWTIHGLWPDFCNGSYTQYCDLSRQYDPSPSPNTTNGQKNGTPVPPYNGSNIGTFVQSFGKLDLLAYMNTYWISQGSVNSAFWGHEFSKHATCYSTFAKACYGPKYVEHEDVVDFFETVVKYYQRLPTFDFLSKFDILPSNTTTYSLSDFEQALTQAHGATPYVGCSGPRFNETSAGRNSTDNGRTEISEVWYYYNVFGRPQDGLAVAVEQTGSSSCAKASGALHYYEPTKSSVRSKVPFTYDPPTLPSYAANFTTAK